jgi:hypothetical protein
MAINIQDDMTMLHPSRTVTRHISKSLSARGMP